MSSTKRTEPTSREVARERLEKVLLKDHANLTPQVVQLIRADILKVLGSYVEMDEADFSLEITRPDAPGADGAELVVRAQVQKFKIVGQNPRG